MLVIIYTVKGGDSVYKIANQYGTTTNDIVYANPDDYTSNSEFIMVTDGVKAGLIEKDALWNEK